MVPFMTSACVDAKACLGSAWAWLKNAVVSWQASTSWHGERRRGVARPHLQQCHGERLLVAASCRCRAASCCPANSMFHAHSRFRVAGVCGPRMGPALQIRLCAGFQCLVAVTGTVTVGWTRDVKEWGSGGRVPSSTALLPCIAWNVRTGRLPKQLASTTV